MTTVNKEMMRNIETFGLNSRRDFWERLLEDCSKIHLNIFLMESPARRVEAAVATKGASMWNG